VLSVCGLAGDDGIGKQGKRRGGYEELALTEKGRLIYGKTSKIEKFCGGCIETWKIFS